MDITNSGIVKDAREVFEGDSLDSFSALVDRRSDLKATIKECEAQTKDLDKRITELLVNNNCQKVQHGKQTVQLCQGSRSVLSKEKLVEHGVPAQTIADCTVSTTYSYLLVK